MASDVVALMWGALIREHNAIWNRLLYLDGKGHDRTAEETDEWRALLRQYVADDELPMDVAVSLDHDGL